MKPKVIIVINTAWNFLNFRSGLIRALVAAGYEVVAVAPNDRYVPRVIALGCRFESLQMDNQGTNPLRDAILFFRLYKLLANEKPKIFLSYTVKPNIYGSLAAHLCGIPVINNIAGLGIVFGKDNLLSRIVRFLYGMALSRSAKVFFQNEDDREFFIKDGLVKYQNTDKLPGSGIDLVNYAPISLQIKPRLRFLLIARMLWDKGVGEYVEAARILKKSNIDSDICLLGFLDAKNPAAISESQMDQWVAEGLVRYLGVSDNVREEIAMADCIVLPSFYREGTPRTLLEAAAMARPIITTDSVGCRDVVDDGVNGFLCRPKDAIDLAKKMAQMIALPHEKREAMGLRGREKVTREFDEKIVIAKYLNSMNEILINSR